MATDALHLNSTASTEVFPRTNSAILQQDAAAPTGTGKAGEPGCIAVFVGHTEPVTGFAIHNGDVISYAGPHLGVLSLHGRPYGQYVMPTRLTNMQGGKDVASIVGLDILPHSHLLVAGTEDGVIKVCH